MELVEKVARAIADCPEGVELMDHEWKRARDALTAVFRHMGEPAKSQIFGEIEDAE